MNLPLLLLLTTLALTHSHRPFGTTLSLFPRGGTATNSPTPLLTTTITTPQQPTLLTDSTVTLSPSTAKSLNVKSGDEVNVIGRRRRTAKATVKVSEKVKGGTLSLSKNIAYNLALHVNDPVKISPTTLPPTPVETPHTFAPTTSSLAALTGLLNVPTVSPDTLQNLFLTPYLSTGGSLQSNAVIVCTASDGTTCEFLLTSSGGTINPGDECTVEDPVPRPIDAIGYESVGGCGKQVQVSWREDELNGENEQHHVTYLTTRTSERTTVRT